MQTLRKKTSPLKYKNETTRFLGDGVSFKAKLIGILEVSEARGDRMCQEALSDLKIAIRAAGEHKQRITINIAIDGLRLRDEKTGDSLYHHPVHKISFIAQDMSDSRAFGYIFGSPDTGHRFFGIKTDKAASQVVIAMRDLFQVVFALKKKEIELAKQHLDKSYYPTSPLFSDSSSSKLQSIPNVSIKSSTEAKVNSNTSESKSTGTAVADLVDLELELNSLQQGLNQMEKITPSDPFGSKDDPFGDSFISYPPKPMLPPPPSTGRERTSRVSETSSIFSPKTPHTGTTIDSDKKKDFSFTQDLSSSHDEPSSGDWFTPSAGNSIFEDSTSIQEPSKDEKHEQTKQEILSQFDVFTELDPLGTGRSKPYIDRKHFFQELKNPPKKVLNEMVSSSQDQSLFTTTLNQTTAKSSVTITTSVPPAQNVYSLDPFGEDPFVKEDPFADSDFSKQDPFETEFSNFKKETVFQSNLSKSPRSCALSLLSNSPNTKSLSKQNTIDVDKLTQFHDNASLEMSSENESAPEPPPRPTNQLLSIKPPPLPPKKQVDLTTKPPPRPPYHTDESPYDFIDKYETAPNSILGMEKSPPLPVPARKTKFEMEAPERPRKQFLSSSAEDYLTPITVPEKSSGILLPPPQKSTKTNAQLNISSFLDTKKENPSLEGLDITLSQLTLSGLNELAQKLKIPAAQLSNMTLVQLTNFLSNFIKSNNSVVPPTTKTESEVGYSNNFADFSNFKPDFATNFSNSNPTDTTYDRYAVFRELMQEEIKQTKIDSEPEEIFEEKEKLENSINSNVNLDLKPLNEEPSKSADRYAALREIVDSELKQTEHKEEINKNEDVEITEEENILNNENINNTETLNIINEENKFQKEINDKEENSTVKSNIIEYITPLEVKNDEAIISPIKQSLKSPVKSSVMKSPVPNAITEIVQSNTRLTSGSLSDVVSGSSPEIDNTASNSDIGKKMTDATAESWAIFDQESNQLESVKEKQAVQSEEGVSPWSSDSKEFGEASPPGWINKDSGSGTEQFPRKRRDQDGWWDTAAESEARYYPANRRSTDSFDEEYYECYDRPRRRRQQSNWQHGNQAAGGHSSSSRDVSPWEEEPHRRDIREMRDPRTVYRHPRTHSFERRRDRRVTDSWDEDDDYEYEDDHSSRHWERHGSRETDRDSRHSVGNREHDSDRWCDERSEDRRHRRRRDPRDRWCCPDWDQTGQEKPRYGRWRDHKTEERYYSRESQESPWEDEYSNDPEDSPHFVTSSKRNWKQRPSSASEIDRKTGDIKSRHYLATGGSDGERDRRYKPSRRSRSRDSQYSEPPHRHKPDAVPSIKTTHRYKFPEDPVMLKKIQSEFKLDSSKKTSTLSRKKIKESLKTEESLPGTFPRKSSSRGKLVFENDFVSPEPSPILTTKLTSKINFEKDFEKSLPLESVRDRPRPATKLSPRYQKSKSHFEDDFSPTEKVELDDNISSIKEEADREDEDEFSTSNFENASNGRKKILSKSRFASGLRTDVNLKKSESVNIFAREDDPFDDDFFCGEDTERELKTSPRTTELRWTDNFEN
ncbi:protein disabled isoform X2 [Diorhabda sublineata]|uniref:protein disabled isoform X2 n=1 Tax=Diorhabda sublineata TaxID=1163346 RepID=UPI0024E0D4AB|nr:protein disabled isoform X2 [Diorhabda sublineata]XP_056645940.1 protein disabled isoform X2 [Diorhabda sublineata]